MHKDFDIRSYLVSIEDMEFYESEAEYAADQVNDVLFAINEKMANHTYWDSTERKDEFFTSLTYQWLREPLILEVEIDELIDYTYQMILQIEQENTNPE